MRGRVLSINDQERPLGERDLEDEKEPAWGVNELGVKKQKKVQSRAWWEIE